MGEIADMMLDGTLDCVTGEYIGDPCGYPRTFEEDETHATAVKRKKRRKKNTRKKEGAVSEAKFTPGPWIESPLSPYIVEVDGGIEIADVAASSLVNATANAHLIAAAPDLYQALSDLIETLQKRGIELDCMSSPTSLISLLNTEEEEAVVASARAALAKSRGEV